MAVLLEYTAHLVLKLVKLFEKSSIATYDVRLTVLFLLHAFFISMHFLEFSHFDINSQAI